MLTERLTDEDKRLLREIGDRMRAARESRKPKYSRRELAADLGYSAQWVIRAELGAIVNLSVIDLFYVAQHLRVTPESLLGRDLPLEMRQRMRTASDFRRLFGDPLAAEALFSVFWAIRQARQEGAKLKGEIPESSEPSDSNNDEEEGATG